MYVARFTADPQDDIQRGWSGWMGCDWKTLQDAAEFHGIETDSQDNDELLDLLSEEGYDIRFDERLNAWRLVHHEGLSCFSLEASSVEAAIEEARNADLKWHGFGSRTLGAVKLVASVDGIDNLYIFECSDATTEH